MIEISLWKFSEIFSLTGAGFNYSSYQHPRRDRGKNTNGCSIVYNIPLAGVFVITLCKVVRFNLLMVCLIAQKYIILKTMSKKICYAKISISLQTFPTLLQSFCRCLNVALYFGHQAYQCFSYNQ